MKRFYQKLVANHRLVVALVVLGTSLLVLAGALAAVADYEWGP